MAHNSWESKLVSSTDLTISYARKALQAEARGPGDLDEAMHRLEARSGVGYWTWWGLWHRRRKSVDMDLFQRVRGAYLAVCERQLAKVQHTLTVEAAKGGSDDFSDLVAEAEDVASRLAEAIRRSGR